MAGALASANNYAYPIVCRGGQKHSMQRLMNSSRPGSVGGPDRALP
jgi:hypothetical protein